MNSLSTPVFRPLRLSRVACYVLVAIAARLAGSAAPIPAEAAEQGLTATEILIGTHASLSGPASSIGQGFRAGEDLAVSEINAHGGINGRTIKIVYEDDAGTAEGGISAVRRLMDQDKVFAIFAGGTSTSTASVVPLVQQSGILYYDSVASDPRILQNYSPNVFSGTAVVRADLAQFAIDVLKNTLKAKTVGYLVADEAACANGVRLMEPLLDGAGIKVLTTQRFRSGDTDYVGQSVALKNANPDVIYLCGLPADGVRFVPQLRRNGVKSKLLADGLLADNVLTRNGGPAMEGLFALWTPSRQYIDERTGPMAEFKARFAKFYPTPVEGTPNGFSVAAYADFYGFAEALRRAGRDLTRDKAIAALETLQNFMPGQDKAMAFGVPVGKPRSFRKGDHKGSREAHLVVVRNGEFRAL